MAESTAYNGLSGDSYAATEAGLLGDGGGNSDNWLMGTLLDVSTAAVTAKNIFSLFGESKVTPGNQGGTTVLERVNQQAGPVASQNTDISTKWYKTVPVWGWVVIGVVFVIGFFGLVGKRIFGRR